MKTFSNAQMKAWNHGTVAAKSRSENKKRQPVKDWHEVLQPLTRHESGTNYLKVVSLNARSWIWGCTTDRSA